MEACAFGKGKTLRDPLGAGVLKPLEDFTEFWRVQLECRS